MENTGFRNTPPVQVGDELDVKIEAVGAKGDGIAKINGYVIFVPNVNEGDELRIKVTKTLRRVGFGEVLGAAQASPETPAEEPAEEAPVEEAPADSEDFGEEAPAEEPAEEVPEDSEDFGEEAPAEEPAEEKAPAKEKKKSSKKKK